MSELPRNTEGKEQVEQTDLDKLLSDVDEQVRSRVSDILDHSVNRTPDSVEAENIDMDIIHDAELVGASVRNAIGAAILSPTENVLLPAPPEEFQINVSVGDKRTASVHSLPPDQICLDIDMPKKHGSTMVGIGIESESDYSLRFVLSRQESKPGNPTHIKVGRREGSESLLGLSLPHSEWPSVALEGRVAAEAIYKTVSELEEGSDEWLAWEDKYASDPDSLPPEALSALELGLYG